MFLAYYSFVNVEARPMTVSRRVSQPLSILPAFSSLMKHWERQIPARRGNRRNDWRTLKSEKNWKPRSLALFSNETIGRRLKRRVDSGWLVEHLRKHQPQTRALRARRGSKWWSPKRTKSFQCVLICVMFCVMSCVMCAFVLNLSEKQRRKQWNK